ncbi:hypothetical protein [Providencia huaxiensis]|uniref:hypothetical protein n=1 Tax=Providencia huaxiensis TaxID=2027290 RepID=UPI0034E3DAC7
MTLSEYINTHYAGNKAAFAKEWGVKPQQVTKWINGKFIVVNHILYSPRRELSKPENNPS